jgi:hypothetical protein
MNKLFYFYYKNFATDDVIDGLLLETQLGRMELGTMGEFRDHAWTDLKEFKNKFGFDKATVQIVELK